MESTTYERLSQREHVLKRTGHYVGSMECTAEPLWIFEKEQNKMVKKPILYSPALLKCVDEILTNATDQVSRDPTLTKITITIDSESGCITIENNGIGIPVVMHDKEKMYIPELVFGEFLTSSNYNDTQNRITGGLHGLGAKLTNVLSTHFSVDIVDSVNKKRFVQTFSQNLSIKSKCKITSSASKGYTRISFTPDYKRFKGVTLPLSNSIMRVFEKRILDVGATLSRSNVKLVYNQEKMPAQNFLDYTKLFHVTPLLHENLGNATYPWQVAVAPYHQFEQISFVNGVATLKGGRHVDLIVAQLVASIKSVLEKKKIDLKPAQIKERLIVFIKATIRNPSFDSQTKETLVTSAKDFGTSIQLSPSFLTKVTKLPLVEELVQFANFKATRDLAKATDGKKTSRVSVPKLEDALWAGTAKSKQTTLILTEGDSAMTWVMKGLHVLGREKYGVFPLKGKLLNVREATANQLKNNEEINHLKTILGLVHDKVYTSTDSLRYGQVLLLTDADQDGKHIQGLLLNMFHVWWPMLLEKQYIAMMRVPIIKATRNNKTDTFYTISDFENSSIQYTKVKYYKGLATYEAKDAHELFPLLHQLTVQYTYTPPLDNEAMHLAFDKQKQYVEQRKEWLRMYDKHAAIGATNQISIHEFVHKELVHFSNYDNIRSIPSMVDGLKVSQRKILYCMLKRKLYDEIKVAQLSGYVSADTNYHHGEASLQNTIIGMAQDFVGSNNAPLLKPIGMFGSRKSGGQDKGSPRYIFTALSEHSSMFSIKDLPIYEYVKEENKEIEPVYFCPTLPLILLNGAQGIGTGFSTFVPCYAKKDIVAYLSAFLKTGVMPSEELVPFYNGFKGTIRPTGISGQWVSTGVYSIQGRYIMVTEIPVDVSVDQYKETMEKCIGKGQIKQVVNLTTDTEKSGVQFKIELETEADTEIIKVCHLSKTFTTNNMYLFNQDGVLTKYATPNEILKEYAHVRLHMYTKRIEYEKQQAQEKLTFVSEKLRFLKGYLNREIHIVDKTKAQLEAQLSKLRFLLHENSYHYLTSQPLHNLTLDQMQLLEQQVREVQSLLKKLETSTPVQLFLQELDFFKV